MQIKLTECNEKWIRAEAKRWSTTSTVMANQMLAEMQATKKARDRSLKTSQIKYEVVKCD